MDAISLADDIFKYILLNENEWIAVKNLLKFVPKILHTVFETLPAGAKSLPILPPDYWHPPQSNFTEYKQDVVAVWSN